MTDSKCRLFSCISLLSFIQSKFFDEAVDKFSLSNILVTDKHISQFAFPSHRVLLEEDNWSELYV